MDTKQLKRISKCLSWMLRHQAQHLQLGMDPEGFVALDEVLAQLRQTIPGISEEAIHAVVNTIEPDKQRFSIVDSYIRANYGHSLATQIAYQAECPPPVLYHGTSTDRRQTILKEGLQPMRRQYVHLTTDTGLAVKVGGRHGKPVVLTVRAENAYRDGIAFYNANKGFWLVQSMPAKYLVED